MRLLINVMILAGSGLMIYNIVRYGMFVKSSIELEPNGKKLKLVVPLLLLVFFLFGYIGVGISGIADLLIASILLGGSIFVFLLLTIMFSIIRHIRETDEILSARYEEREEELKSLTKNSLAVFRVDLTRDEVEEKGGEGLYESDLQSVSYTELLNGRSKYILGGGDGERDLFTRDGLLRAYAEGRTAVSEILPVRRADGEATFVRFEAAMTKKPVSDDVVAFITERECNEEVAKKALLEKVMLESCDKVAYIIDGEYHEMISSNEKKVVIPRGVSGRYEDIYLNYILPAMAPQETCKKNPLRYSVISEALSQSDVYKVNGLFELSGEMRRKEFLFHLADETADFYLLQISDRGGAEGEAGPGAAAQRNAPGGLGAPATGDTATGTRAPEASSSAPADGGGRRVLLVDDNEVNREIGELLMSAEGFLIETAVNGEEAAKAVENAAPGYYSAVLMDVNMPVLGGCEATARIRANGDPLRASVPIIALTATASEEELRACMEAGMNDFDTKPLDAARVRNKLLKLIYEKEAKGGAAGGKR